MSRELTLRQIEGFRAVVESGTISNAAVKLKISQPAMSKLITHLEEDAGLVLFDRSRRRLVLTERGRRFYEEIDRIFAGVRQVQKVAEAIRREERGQLKIGVMPALSGAFIQRATSSFLRDQPHVFCSVESHHSDRITELLATHRLDVGLVHGRIESRYILPEILLEHPLVCIMPEGHPLESQETIRPQHLDGVRFIGLDVDSFTAKQVAQMMEEHDVKPNVALTANLVSTACEFVAAGEGVSLIHPLFVSGFEYRMTIRRFEPALPYSFQICRSLESRNGKLVQAFLTEMRRTATDICNVMGIPSADARERGRIARADTAKAGDARA